MRPKPQARAIRAARRSNFEADDTTIAENGAPLKPALLVNLHPLPKADDVLKLLSARSDISQEQQHTLKMNFHLLAAYVSMQAKHPDQEWAEMVQDGRVIQAINIAFEANGVAIYGPLARALIA